MFTVYWKNKEKQTVDFNKGCKNNDNDSHHE